MLQNELGTKNERPTIVVVSILVNIEHLVKECTVCWKVIRTMANTSFLIKAEIKVLF